jgi:hypothetical protein
MKDFFVFGDSTQASPVIPPNPQTKPVVRRFDVFPPEQQIVAPVVPVVPTEVLPPWAKYEGKSLSDEDILKDPELMSVVDKSLEAMFGSNDTLAKDVAQVGVALTGGATGWFKGKSPEDRLEIWNNFNRKFAGGQSVTTLNTAAHIGLASKEDQADIGAGFLLFDQKGNIFTGEGTWGEMFDGMFDYTKAVIHDPVTLASLGVGKALTAGGSKAASMALKATAMAAYRAALKSGSTREAAALAARQATRMGYVSLGAKNVAKYSAVDFAANIGLDVSYQDSLIEVGAQEKYSLAQTGVVALGTIVLPAIIAGVKGVSSLAKSARAASVNNTKRGLFEAYVDVQRKFGGLGNDAIEAAVMNRINLNNVNGPLKTTFQNFKSNINNFLPWSDAKIDANRILNRDGIELTAGENQNLFWKSFIFGDTTGSQKGFAQSMADAGFVYVPRAKDDKFSNFFGDAMSYLDDAVVKNMVADFESTVGKAFSVPIETAEQLASAFKTRQSIFGSGLFDSKRAQDLIGKVDVNAGDLLKQLEREVTEVRPELGKYALSIWKRLVTSHPATTGLNLKGWANLSILNAASDVVLGGLKLGEAGVYKLAGNVGAYQAALNASKGSILGNIKRGYNILKFNDTMESAENYLLLKPDLYEKLSSTASGGTEAGNVLKHFNIDPNTLVGKGATNITEPVVNAIQTIYGVKLQDEVTKLLSFHSALEQGILREYGENFNQFMSRPDAYVEMFSPRFKNNVDSWALNRTLRETASKNWSQKKGRGVFLAAAKGFEAISRSPIGGYAIPFGSFMNTAFATLADYAGFNAVKHLTARSANALGIANYRFDFAEEEGADLIAKGLVGWGAVTTYYLPEALDKVEKGLTWNQSERGDGTLADYTYDFPVSYLRMIAQAAAHAVKDGEVPTALKEEMANVLGGQPFRQLDEAGRQVYEFVGAVLSGEIDESVRSGLTILSTLGSRIVSGVFRPLDPLNQAAIFMSEDYTTIDRKQASSKFLAQSFRYVDQIFGGFEAPAQATVTRGYDILPVDPGKTLGGNRTARTPNSIERVLASVGKAPWQAVKWSGDDQVKNFMDGIIGPILNAQAEKLLEREPNFFELPLASREKRLKEVTDISSSLAGQVLDYSFSELGDVISLKKDLATLNKQDVKRAMKYLGIEGDPLDLTKEEGGLDKLQMLIFFSKNYQELLVE